MTLAWALAAAWAQGVDPRRAATDAEAAGEYAAAMANLQVCVATSGDRDRRYCESRLEVLGPQAADEFAGWRTLERVRRHPALGAGEARSRVQEALDANPGGPAAPHLARWLAHDALRGGSPSAAPVAATDEAWLTEQRAIRARQSRHSWIGRVGLALGASYLLAAVGGSIRARRAGTSAGHPLPVAGTLLLGGGPLVLATIFDPENFADFALAGTVVATCLLAATRCHPAVAGLGTLGALTWAASANGWLASLGIP